MSPTPSNKERFSWPQAELSSAWSPDLADWWGRRVDRSGKRVVRFNGKHWFVKFKPDPEEQKRDYLAYLLGRSWVNVAEVRALSESEFEDLRHVGIVAPKWASKANTLLVRLGQDYTVDQLPNAGIDAAVASELVFSLWIRRRDTHAANRVYINSVPVFFDHHTGFLGEPQLMNLDVFFKPGPDAGHASRWRVEIAGPEATVSTEEVRRIGRARDMALHFARDLELFNKSIQDAAERVQSQGRDEWLRAARAAGLSETRAQEITTFLEKNCAELGVAIEKMRAVIFQPWRDTYSAPLFLPESPFVWAGLPRTGPDCE
ncbi:MAG: hypothetical protein HY914_02190 [Desulfomonile tiedjei]|nr:hypothetical protein [Desulfomonile tiedjei]